MGGWAPSASLFGAAVATRPLPPHPRRQLLHAPDARASVNDYFFSLVARVHGDVTRQPDNPQKAGLLLQLDAIKAEAAAAGGIAA